MIGSHQAISMSKRVRQVEGKSYRKGWKSVEHLAKRDNRCAVRAAWD